VANWVQLAVQPASHISYCSHPPQQVSHCSGQQFGVRAATPLWENRGARYKDCCCIHRCLFNMEEEQLRHWNPQFGLRNGEPKMNTPPKETQESQSQPQPEPPPMWTWIPVLVVPFVLGFLPVRHYSSSSSSLDVGVWGHGRRIGFWLLLLFSCLWGGTTKVFGHQPEVRTEVWAMIGRRT